MYTDAKAGTVDYVNLNTSTMETAKSEGLYDQYAVVSDTDATSFLVDSTISTVLRLQNANDGTTAKSTKSDEEIQRTNKALQNGTSGRAISFAADRGAYNAQQVGEDLRYTSLEIPLPRIFRKPVKGTLHHSDQRNRHNLPGRHLLW